MEYYFVPEDQDPENPCVSIVVPVICHGDISALVHRVVRSAVRQTHENWKLYLIADGCPELDHVASEELARKKGGG
jgi:hypothetical protein